MVCLARSGTVAFGVGADGQHARASGWGPLFLVRLTQPATAHMLPAAVNAAHLRSGVAQDAGSGYAMGQAALAVIAREADGRGPETALTGLVLAHLGLPSTEQLLRFKPTKHMASKPPNQHYHVWLTSLPACLEILLGETISVGFPVVHVK